MTNDERFMRSALDLAARGRGAVEPNPMVGCVITRDGRAIGEAWHERFGHPHAEPKALAACTESTEGATAYVTLEPCCHKGKKTPPCVPQLIGAGLRRVVIACLDPNPAVAGKGIAELREAGIEVLFGVLEEEAQQLNAPFFARQTLSRPYTTLKWAQSAEGKVAGPGGLKKQISGDAALRASHFLRAGSDAILIGIKTALADDPMLTTRGVAPQRTLLRVILDSSLRLPPASRLAQTACRHRTLAAFDESLMERDALERAEALQELGVVTIGLPREPGGGLSLAPLLSKLSIGERVTHLIVEGGPTVQRSFVRENLADRAWVVQSPMKIQADDAPAAVTLPVNFQTTQEIWLAEDRLKEWLNVESPVFFGRHPSADFARLT